MNNNNPRPSTSPGKRVSMAYTKKLSTKVNGSGMKSVALDLNDQEPTEVDPFQQQHMSAQIQ